MPDTNTFFWLFFKLTGRVGRAAYVLGFLFMLIVASFPLYQFMRFPEEAPAAQGWSLAFGLAFLAFLWSHVALSVKRLHDIGKPGIMSLALFIPIVSVIAFIMLCVMPGNAGPNAYGRVPDAPK